MVLSTRWGLFLSALLVAGAAELRAQQPVAADKPQPFVPLRPDTPANAKRRQAQTIFALGMLRQRQDRLVDALRNLEEARKLDPDAAAVPRALILLYQAVGRSDDALDACRQVLDREPDDHQTWYAYARQLRELGRQKEALDALNRAVACPSVKEFLELQVQMHFDRGVLYEEAKDLARAEGAFTEVIHVLVDKREALIESGPFSPEQIDSEAAKTYERIGQICTQTAKYDHAVAAFQKAQKRDPDSAARLNYNLAEVCLAQGKPADALRYLDEYLRSQPAGDKAYELKITLLKRLNREQDIIPGLTQAARRDGHNVPLQLLLARQYAQAKQWDDAKALYLKLSDDSPASDVFRGLLVLYVERAKQQGKQVMNGLLDLLDQTITAAAEKADGSQGDAVAAARARGLVAVLRDDPEVVKDLLDLAIGDLRRRERGFDTLRLLAALATNTRQTDYAAQLYRQCLARVTPQTEAEVYGGLLEALAGLRKYDEVVRVARDGLRQAQATNRILFHVSLARALAALGKNDEALVSADEAVKLADDRSRLRMRRFRVEILRQLERYDDAVAECQSLFKDFSQPGDIRDIRYSLSNVYSSAKAHDKAEEQLRLILETDPNDATANNDLGYIMADRSKNLEESEQLIRKAIELDRAEKKAGSEVRLDGPDDNAAYLDSLGWVLFRRGQLAEAREWLEKAAALPGGNDDPVVWDHLGDVYFRQKDSARARTVWEKSVRLYEQEKRRKPDEKYKELKLKLELVKN